MIKRRLYTWLLLCVCVTTFTACSLKKNPNVEDTPMVEESINIIVVTPTPKEDAIPSAAPEDMPPEVNAEITPQPEASVEQLPEIPSEPIAPSNQYTYTDLDAVKYTTSKVNVRALPTTEGEKLGSLELNSEVKVTGQCNETSWFRIDYKGSAAFVSNDYLADEKAKVEVTAATNASTSSSSKTNTSEPCPYPLHQLMYDSRGCAYFYDYYGGSATMAPDDYAKSSAAFNVYNDYTFDYIVKNGMDSFLTSWKLIGTYAEGKIVVRWTCFGNNYDTKPEDFGIPTEGNGIF